jgi:hypothetical protein
MRTIQLTRAQRRRLQTLAEKFDRVAQADAKFFERFPHRRHRVSASASFRNPGVGNRGNDPRDDRSRHGRRPWLGWIGFSRPSTDGWPVNFTNSDVTRGLPGEAVTSLCCAYSRGLPDLNGCLHCQPRVKTKNDRSDRRVNESLTRACRAAALTEMLRDRYKVAFPLSFFGLVGSPSTSIALPAAVVSP